MKPATLTGSDLCAGAGFADGQTMMRSRPWDGAEAQKPRRGRPARLTIHPGRLPRTGEAKIAACSLRSAAVPTVPALRLVAVPQIFVRHDALLSADRNPEGIMNRSPAHVGAELDPRDTFGLALRRTPRPEDRPNQLRPSRRPPAVCGAVLLHMRRQSIQLAYNQSNRER